MRDTIFQSNTQVRRNFYAKPGHFLSFPVKTHAFSAIFDDFFVFFTYFCHLPAYMIDPNPYFQPNIKLYPPPNNPQN